MAFKDDFNVFIGAKYGIFKALKVTSDQPTINKTIQSLNHLSKSADVTAMAWGDDDEEEILLGLSNQVVKVYDSNYKAFISSTDVSYTASNGTESKGSICGLSRYDGALLTAVESGHVRLWRYGTQKALEFDAGGPVSRMKHSFVNPNIVGTGGLENELKLWDLTSGRNTFTAKNVAPDSLQLRVKVWVNDLSFLSGTNKVVIGSRYGYVRLYDPNAQRRPVMNVELQDKAVCCLTSRSSDQTVLCGLATGDIQAIDLRVGRPAKKYCGFFGAVRDIACHPSEPVVVSVSLDRYLRVHHLETKVLLLKEYMLSRMDCLLMRSNFTLKAPVTDSIEKCDNAHLESAPEEFKEMLDSMEQVSEKGVHQKRLAVSRNQASSCKKKKTSTFVNPFAGVDISSNSTPGNMQSPTKAALENDSDDDIQILRETVNTMSSNSVSDVDEAEGSSSDLNEDDIGAASHSPIFNRDEKIKRKYSPISNPFHKCSDIS